MKKPYAIESQNTKYTYSDMGETKDKDGDTNNYKYIYDSGSNQINQQIT